MLRVHLRAVEADWRPVGDDEPGAIVLAFAEGDGPPEIPSPLLRVPVGTRVEVTLQNTVDSTLVVHGLAERVASRPAPVIVPPRETRTVSFIADSEGTYFYWGRIAADAGQVSDDIADRFYRDVPLSGAFVVDPAGGGPAEHEEVLLMTAYHHRYPGSDQEPLLQTINGRPWPHTKRMRYTQGDSVRWRIINTAERGHPMHLHGFYFRVDSQGDIAKDTLYWPSQKRMAVTEEMAPGSTLGLTWSPDRPGGWLFHCHISVHVGTNPVLGEVAPDPDQGVTDTFLGDPHHDPEHHVEQGMGGLMMAVDVEPAADWAPDDRTRRVMRAMIVSDSTPAPEGTPFQPFTPHMRRFALVTDSDSRVTPDNPVPFPGSPLILRRGEPTTIWVVNDTAEPTAIHWHGLELESLYDGVVGVGGYVGSRTPPVMPGDSFEVRITPPRAGTFMYHTHLNDIRQQGGGLYGPFLVLEPDAAWDPDRDRLLLLGNGVDGFGPFLNGVSEMAPATLEAGESYRLRFMNITLLNNGLRIMIMRNGYPWRWVPVAKDGADLPPDLRRETLADARIRVGETADYLFTPAPGTYSLEVRSGRGNLFASQTFTVPSPDGS